MSTLRFRITLLRKDPRLPVFIRVPGEVVAPWKLADWQSVEGNLNGHDFGRRTIKDWGKDSPDWFVEFVKPYVDGAGLKPGDEVEVELRLADMTMPDELAARMRDDADFARAYEALIPNHKRKVVEHYLEAKTPAGRTARLEKISHSIKARLKPSRSPRTCSGAQLPASTNVAGPRHSPG